MTFFFKAVFENQASRFRFLRIFIIIAWMDSGLSRSLFLDITSFQLLAMSCLSLVILFVP